MSTVWISLIAVLESDREYDKSQQLNIYIW